jgi:hypothetical protein
MTLRRRRLDGQSPAAEPISGVVRIFGGTSGITAHSMIRSCAEDRQINTPDPAPFAT